MLCFGHITVKAARNESFPKNSKVINEEKKASLIENDNSEYIK